MVQVTEQAANALAELLAQNAAPPEAGIRLKPSAGGNLGMVIDEPQDGDEVVSRDDTPLLIMDRGVAPGLHDLVVDYQVASNDGTASSEGFVLRPPSSSD